MLRTLFITLGRYLINTITVSGAAWSGCRGRVHWCYFSKPCLTCLLPDAAYKLGWRKHLMRRETRAQLRVASTHVSYTELCSCLRGLERSQRCFRLWLDASTWRGVWRWSPRVDCSTRQDPNKTCTDRGRQLGDLQWQRKTNCRRGEELSLHDNVQFIMI